MDDVRIYFKSVVVLIVLWVIAAVAGTLAGLPTGTLAVILVLIGGFAGQIIARYATAADEARERALVVRKAEDAVNQVHEVRVALQIADLQRQFAHRQRAAEIAADRKTLHQIHYLVNDVHGKALRALADALRVVANLTPTSHEAERAAQTAEDAVRDHDHQQAQADAATAQEPAARAEPERATP